MTRQCNRSGCCESATATLGYDYAQRTARYAYSAAGDRQAAELGKYRQQWEKLEGREPVRQQEQAKAQQAEREADKDFGKEMNRQLQQGGAKPGDKKDEPKPVQLGAREGDKAQNEKDQAVEQWLQRVPDDPGGLLRRKFRLEYEIRKNGGRVPQDEGE